MTKRRIPLGKIVTAIIVILVLIQAVPYGRNHINPPVLREPAWDRPATRELAMRACFGCHSNETVWPWYSQVAPISWLVQHDVDEGRRKLNFSDWRNGARKGERPEEIREEVTEGEMPPLMYRLAHPQARLSEEQKRELVDGVARFSRR
ncbi:heme-binding domain-containing protein [Geomesophilobacter sediminis]|nr:heme-binding domain-containing protein [Geomesophilobacter sediminis]